MPGAARLTTLSPCTASKRVCSMSGRFASVHSRAIARDASAWPGSRKMLSVKRSPPPQSISS